MNAISAVGTNACNHIFSFFLVDYQQQFMFYLCITNKTKSFV